MGLEIYSYVDWVRAERRLVRALGDLIKWGWVSCDERQKKRATSFGATPTGRRSWQNRRSIIVGDGEK